MVAGWFWLGYCLLAALCWRSLVRSALAAMQNGLGLPLDGMERAISFFSGTGMAVFWPVAIVVRLAYRVATRSGLLETELDKRLEAERKLAEAKAQAYAMGFTWPEEEE